MFVTTLTLLGLISGVVSHGGAMHYEIDGEIHNGNHDAIPVPSSPAYSWSWDAITSLQDPHFPCRAPGLPHEKNSYHAKHTAGSVISINYTIEKYKEDDGRFWTFGHTHGPMSGWLAKCPEEEGCEGVDVNGKIWFKIFEAGLLSGTWTTGYWSMRDIQQGANLDVLTPPTLKPGKYLFRHEMINLEGGAAQFFANCLQLDVSGDGGDEPEEEELVSFPGGYDEDEEISFVTLRGSEWFYTEHGDDTEYKPPGPKCGRWCTQNV